MDKTQDDADREIKERIVKLIREDKVVFADDIDLINQPEGPVRIRSFKPFDKGFIVAWSKPGFGFGELTFYIRDNRVRCHSECTNKKFVKEVMDAFIESMVIED